MRISNNSIKEKTWYVILSLVKICTCQDERLPTCFSDIYCHGKLLHTIQMANISDDSKTFVDMKMIHSPKETITHFNTFMEKFKNKPNRADIIEFVNTNFEHEGQELEDWTPSDWIPHPKFVDGIADVHLREWAIHLNGIWKILGKKIKDEVENNKDHYSIIWVPNPFVIPGGRFREYYYWDTYWIVQGLLLSEMHNTTRGVLENLLYIVDQYGLIPNGGRIYYLGRSQPPLFIPMVKLYFDYTHDIGFLSKYIHLMEKEFSYWMNNHNKVIRKDGKRYILAMYGDKTKGPRPESYSEDVESGKIFTEDNEKEEFYSEIKAAAESGLDFSSRWFVYKATNKGNLTDIKTRSIVPVDLNAMLYWNAKLLSEFNSLLNNKGKAQKFNYLATNLMKAVTSVLWHEEIGSWLDYDILNNVERNYFYPTNIAPLWTGCYNVSNKDKIVPKVIKYLKSQQFLYPGGVPTSFELTGEQWDFPNAWPPLQHMMIIGLNNTGNYDAIKLAYEIAEKWVRSNFQGFDGSNEMYEKYDVTVPGDHGGGGEYVVQKGFGWTNGVIMDLLSRYGLSLTADGLETSSASSINSITMGRWIGALISLISTLTFFESGFSML